MRNLVNALKNKRDIKENAREINQIAKKLSKLKSVYFSPIELITPFYNYVIAQTISNNKPLKNCFLNITKKVYEYDGYTIPSYEDIHEVTIHSKNIKIEFLFLFVKSRYSNFDGYKNLEVHPNGLKYMQIYLQEGGKQFPLLEENKQNLLHPLIFENDVPEKLEKHVYQTLCALEKNWGITIKKNKKKEEQKWLHMKTEADVRHQVLSRYS